MDIHYLDPMPSESVARFIEQSDSKVFDMSHTLNPGPFDPFAVGNLTKVASHQDPYAAPAIMIVGRPGSGQSFAASDEDEYY